MRIIVVGAGFAGMAAACRLAGDGHAVTVLEAAPRLGGRAASSERNGHALNDGEHVLMSCCTAARGFFARIGASDVVSFQESFAIPLLFDGRRWVFRSWPLPGAAHLLPGLLGYAPLSGRERVAALRAGLALWASRSLREETFEEWLVRHGQTEKIVRRLWDPIAIATLKAPSSVVSLRAARHLFRNAFFAPHGADVGLFAQPLVSVFAAARRYLEARDGTVELSARVGGILVGDRRARGVRLSTGHEIDGDAVISAVPPDELARLVSGAPELAAIVGAATRLEWAPIVNVHLTFDREVLNDDLAVGIDSLVQAVFRPHRQLVEADVGASTPALATHATPRGGKAVLSRSSATEWIDLGDAEIVATLHQALRDLLPSARDATLLDSLVLRHRQATFVPSPGSDALRPKSRTPIAGLYLAGDWTSTGWPSTIEGAVLSGVYAAAALESDSVAGGTSISDIKKGNSEA